MSDIIRAEKLIYDAFAEKGNVLSPLELAELMKQFAKLHVEAALEASANEYYPKDKESFELITERFINAYPLTNIK